MHRYLLHNGHIRETTDSLLSPGQVGFMNGWGVFSTFRVSQRVLFAFDRHFRRMEHDAALLRVPFDWSAAELEDTLLRLVDANQALDATLRAAVVRNRGGLFESPAIERESDLVAFTAPMTEWGPGVKLTYVPNARFGASPFTGMKATSWAQNLAWNEDAHVRGFDEALLLNEHGHVSECTSANVFAIYDHQVSTPPLSTSGCLPGVTRALLLEELKVHGYSFSERELTPSDLEAADQVFVTSTTRDLIPVLEVDHEPLKQSSELFAPLKAAFLEYRAAYLSAHASRRRSFAA